MIEVKLYTVEGSDPKSVYKGSFLYDNGKLTAKPADKKDQGMLNYLMDEEFITPAGNIYDPSKDPEGWINHLYLSFKSYGLTASKPAQVKG